MTEQSNIYIQKNDSLKVKEFKNELFAPNGRYFLYSFNANDETDITRCQLSFDNIEKAMRYLEENSLFGSETIYIIDSKKEKKYLEICPYDEVIRFF